MRVVQEDPKFVEQIEVKYNVPRCMVCKQYFTGWGTDCNRDECPHERDIPF